MPPEDAVSTGPVVFAPRSGPSQAFECFRHVRASSGAEARDHAFAFTADVGDRRLQACASVHIGDGDAGRPGPRGGVGPSAGRPGGAPANASELPAGRDSGSGPPSPVPPDRAAVPLAPLQAVSHRSVSGRSFHEGRTFVPPPRQFAEILCMGPLRVTACICASHRDLSVAAATDGRLPPEARRPGLPVPRGLLGSMRTAVAAASPSGAASAAGPRPAEWTSGTATGPLGRRRCGSADTAPAVAALAGCTPGGGAVPQGVPALPTPFPTEAAARGRGSRVAGSAGRNRASRPAAFGRTFSRRPLRHAPRPALRSPPLLLLPGNPATGAHRAH